MAQIKKNVLIIGGSGYVGTGILKIGLKVPELSFTSVQRNLPLQNKKELNVNYLKGSALEPETFEEQIKAADIIIHSLGVLFDSSVPLIGRKATQGNGTYREINFETAKRVADIANKHTNKKRKFFYLSADGTIPFIPAYLESKHLSEDYLKIQQNLWFNSFRPGVIYDWKTKPFLGLISPFFNGVNFLWRQSPASWRTSNSSILKFFQNFYCARAIRRENVAKSILYCALENEYDGKNILEHDDIMRAAKLFDEKYGDKLK